MKFNKNDLTLYLRLLDAFTANAPIEEIARILYPKETLEEAKKSIDRDIKIAKWLTENSSVLVNGQT